MRQDDIGQTNAYIGPTDVHNLSPPRQ